MDFKDNVLKKLNTTNIFSVTYRKDKFAISDKEYPIGYTSFLVTTPTVALLMKVFLKI